MKLVTGQFNDSFQPVMDGVANVTKNYAYWLTEKYGQNFVVTPAFPKYTDNENFEVIRYMSVAIPKRPPYRLGMPHFDYVFNKRISKIPFNIVHAHCPFTSGQVALKIAQKRQIPIVATFHSKYYDDFKAVVKTDKLAELCTRKIIDFYNDVDVVWTVNKSTVETLRSYGFKKQVEVVYNGTDFIPPDNIEEYSRIADKRLNLNPDELVFLFVGQHILQKNLKMLIYSLHHLKAMSVDFKMYFAGKGSSEKVLKELVTELGLEKNVYFLGMVLDRDFLKSLFTRANLLLFPSIYDNAPIVVQEAASVKCPSIVIENSNASEGIIDSYNGFLSRDDSEAYAKKIYEAISDREKLNNIGETAQKTIYKNWEKIVAEVGERYKDIIKTYDKISKNR